MQSWEHSDNCWRNSDRKFDFSGIPVLTTPSWPLTLHLMPRPQLVLPHRRNGVQKPYSCVAGLPLDQLRQKKLTVLKVANELLSCLPHGLQNNVVVRAPFAANHQISFEIKDGGGWDSCRAVQLALSAGIQTNMIEVRGHQLKVSIELAPRKKATLRNMFRAESFLKKSGVNSASYVLCFNSSKILSNTNEELGGTPKGSNDCVWNRENCASCGTLLVGWEEFKE